MVSLAIGLGTSIIGGIITSKGEKKAAQEEQRGEQEQLRVEALNREFQEEQFDKQIARQEPFVQAGTEAIDPLIQAISNRGDVSGLPSTQIQGGLISDFLGAQAPGFVTDRALGDLEAIEADKNKGRLSDLVNIGLGGVGSQAGSGANLGSTLGQSLATSGNIAAQSITDAAANRENRRNQLFQGVTGLPSLAVTAFQNRPQQPVNPFITAQNPLGLTPGAGL